MRVYTIAVIPQIGQKGGRRGVFKGNSFLKNPVAKVANDKVKSSLQK